MKFVIERGVLVAALTRAGKVVRRGNTIPILDNVKLVAKQDSLILETNDIDSGFIVTAPAAVAKPGGTTVNVRALAAFIALVPDGAQVECETDAAKGRLIVRAGRSNAKLATLPVEDFPAAPHHTEAVELTIGGKDLAQALGRVVHAISNEETRYYLNGVYMHAAEGSMKFVATDGHRLALASIAITGDLPEFVPPIIPRAAVTELLALAGAAETIDLEISATRIKVAIPGTVYVSKLIDGTFPDYDRVIPRELKNSFETGRVELVEAARRVAVISEQLKTGRAIKITTSKGLLTLNGHSDGGEIEDEIEARTDGTETVLGCNVAYLVNALDAFAGGPVHCKYDGGSPMVFTQPGDDGHMQIVMPMRV